MKKVLIPTVIFIISSVVLYFENSQLFLGKILTKIKPCVFDPMNSFPCYYGVDLIFNFILIGVVFSSFAIAITLFFLKISGKLK